MQPTGLIGFSLMLLQLQWSKVGHFENNSDEDTGILKVLNTGILQVLNRGIFQVLNIGVHILQVFNTGQNILIFTIFQIRFTRQRP